MTDPNDFTTSLATVIDSLQDRVRHGVEQPAPFLVFFKSGVTSYELPAGAIAVTRVTGMRAGGFTVFQEGVDYAFSVSRLSWLNAVSPPDDGSRLDIEYTFREAPSGLTDFNPGSVVGTLLRAVAREMTVLYGQMDEAYRRAFIDDASGAALDNVVALLGVSRKAAVKSTGTITFVRKRPATQTVVIPPGTRVADQSGRIFVTTREGRIPTEMEEVRTPAGSTVRTTNRIAELIGVFRREEDPGTAVGLPHDAGFADDERTVTLTGAPPAGDVRISYKPRSVTVSIEAQEPGPDGDVNATTLTLMPTPPRDVDGVVNENPTRGGQDAEPDDRLRDRAKHALERAGNATLNAIKFAVLEVAGVQGVEVLDHQRDDSIPLGEVRVRYSGGELNDVKAAVERTRAAGVMARVEEIITVSVSGVFYLFPAEKPLPGAADTFLGEAAKLIASLEIGAPLAVRRVSSLAFNVPGLADVAEAQLLVHKPTPSSPGVALTADPLLATPSELIRPLIAALKGILLAKLVATAHRTEAAGARYAIDLQVLDDQGGAVKFRDLSVDVRLTARATLAANPTQPAVRVGAVTKTVRFADSASATLTLIVATDLTDFRPLDHTHTVEFSLAAAAYPGLAPATRAFDVTV